MADTAHAAWLRGTARWLRAARAGARDYQSTQAPFGVVSEDQDSLPVPMAATPEGAARVARVAAAARWPRRLKTAYQLFGYADREFQVGDWNFFSLQKIEDRLRLYAAQGQPRICDIAVQYEGMGHFRVMCVDAATGRLFQRLDGGANDYERQHHWDFVRELDLDTVDATCFYEWNDTLHTHAHMVSPYNGCAFDCDHALPGADR